MATVNRRSGNTASVRAVRLGDPLSDRERLILILVARGYTNVSIGLELHLTDNTVAGLLRVMFAKTGARCRTTLVTRAFAPFGFGIETAPSSRLIPAAPNATVTATRQLVATAARVS